MEMLKTVNIRPGVSILSVLKHLNYKPWYALAEFVDNAIDSYQREKKVLHEIEGENYKLKVFIEINSSEKKIIIRDNAGGIHDADYQRAFRPAEIPPDTSGLSEFGMGMKSAACWFTNFWRVKTSALGEPVERIINFDINKIVEDKIEELNIQTLPKGKNTHYTVIELLRVQNFPVGRSLTKIKEHLISIYREFMRLGLIHLELDSEPLNFNAPKILVAPYYKDESGNSIKWEKKIEFDFGADLKAKGFAALRETSSTSAAGFALFRRNRVIEGSADEGFRPEYIFGKPNSFRYGRLFGELHLEGFNISHTKDGFQWDENMEIFIKLLRDELETEPMKMLSQAEGYRKRLKKEELETVSKKVIKNTSETIKKELPPILNKLREKEGDGSFEQELKESSNTYFREIEIELRDTVWSINIELSYDPAIAEWLEVGDHLVPKDDGNNSNRKVGIRLSLVHPFMERYASADDDKIEPILRVAAAIGLAEVLARESGIRYASTIRNNINEILTEALSKP